MTNLWNLLDELKSEQYRWVDLSHPFSVDAPHWRGFGELEVKTVYEFGPDCPFHTDRYNIPAGQFGTHVDAPCHFNKGFRTLDQMGLTEMAYPLVVVDKSDACMANPDYELTVGDLQEWEAEHGIIPKGAFVAFRSDWSKRRDLNNYDEMGEPHYPGWSLEALQWLVEERHIGAIGHESSDTDAPAAKTGLICETYILKTDRLQVELMANLDNVPAAGAIIFVTFLNVVGGSGFPARVFAICPK